jgi:soluble lytic murein transglycosylase-like protein
LSEKAGFPEPRRRPAASRIARILTALTLAASSLALASCQEGRAFGMELSDLGKTLAGKDPAPILGLDDRSLGDPGKFGPAGWYYLALWLESRASSAPEEAPQAAGRTQADPDSGDDGEAVQAPAAAGDRSSMIMRLFRLAYERGSGLVKEKAADALLKRLESAGDFDGLLELTGELEGAQSRAWRIHRARLGALDGLRKNDEVLDELDRIRIAFPEESAADADALDCFEAAARARNGSSGGTTRSLAAIRRIIIERPTSDWTARAMAIAAEAEAAKIDGASSLLSADEARAGRMRVAVRGRDYAPAYKEAAAASRQAVAAAPATLADAGKAYLYSGMSKEGAVRFAEIEGAARESGAKAAAWTALFYRGRFARALEKWADAASLFGRAAVAAGSAGASRADAEAARWYAAECAGKAAEAQAAAAIAKVKAKAGSQAALKAERKARAASLDALISASKEWSDPAAFSDLADELFREAMRERDWDLIERMSAELSPRLTKAMGARIAYAAARAGELGLSKPGAAAPGASAPRERFAQIARDASAPPYYRALASWRSGEGISTAPARTAAAETDAKATPGDLESYIGGFADFGLGGIAVSEARSAADRLDAAELRRIAARLAGAGMYGSSLQVAAAIVAKKDYAPARDDYYLLYPRPYLKEIRGLDADPRLSERLILGLVRSESAFMADVRSSAGAIGLTQLMPATAAEQAKALGMKEYDLESPSDNLRIGIAHFSRLYDRAGSPLRAMMAYNAGMSRLNAWAADGEGLPDDLLVETLTIAETRQYCRNILQAAAMYGELYEGVLAGATAQRIVGGK